jgi:hypothetical protein
VVFLHGIIFLQGQHHVSRTVVSTTCMCYTSNHEELIPTCNCCPLQEQLNAPNDIQCTLSSLVCLCLLLPIATEKCCHVWPFLQTEPESMFSVTVPRIRLTHRTSRIVVLAYIMHRPLTVGESDKGGIAWSSMDVVGIFQGELAFRDKSGAFWCILIDWIEIRDAFSDLEKNLW